MVKRQIIFSSLPIAVLSLVGLLFIIIAIETCFQPHSLRQLADDGIACTRGVILSSISVMFLCFSLRRERERRRRRGRGGGGGGGGKFFSIFVCWGKVIRDYVESVSTQLF